MAKGTSLTAAAVLAIAISGCISNTETQQKLSSAWAGRPADEFFIKNGPPNSTHRLDGGGAIYSWSGGHESYSLPGASTTTFSPSWGGATVATTTTTAPSKLNISCSAQIVTDSSGRIQEIRLTKDTIGAWQLSRCNEIFAST